MSASQENRGFARPGCRVARPRPGATQSRNPNRPRHGCSEDELERRALEIVQASFDAARRGDTDALRIALDAGLPADVYNDKGDSLVMLSSYHGHLEATRLLLQRGADPNVVNDRGLTPLQGVAFKGDAALMSVLLEGGADARAHSPDGKSALMFARMFGHAECTALLERATRGTLEAHPASTGSERER